MVIAAMGLQGQRDESIHLIFKGLLKMRLRSDVENVRVFPLWLPCGFAFSGLCTSITPALAEKFRSV